MRGGGIAGVVSLPAAAAEQLGPIVWPAWWTSRACALSIGSGLHQDRTSPGPLPMARGRGRGEIPSPTRKPREDSPFRLC